MPRPPLPPVDPRFDAFFMLTGFTFVFFAAGFGVCLFNLETIDACVEVSEKWMYILKGVGDHLIAWAIALGHAVFRA